MSELRINARLDDVAANDLSFLREELGNTSITDAVKYSISKVARELRDNRKAKQQNKIWLDSGFVGGFVASKDLSSNYKHHISDILDEKYPPTQ